MTATDGEVVVAGIGTLHRGDDGAGLAVARLVKAARPGLTVIECDGDVERLIDAWDGARLAIVVDAARSGHPAGTVRRLLDAEPLAPGPAPASSHGLGLAEVVALARVLGRVPRELVVYAVEGRDFHAGEALSAPVAAAVRAVAQRVLREVDRA